MVCPVTQVNLFCYSYIHAYPAEKWMGGVYMQIYVIALFISLPSVINLSWSGSQDHINPSWHCFCVQSQAVGGDSREREEKRETETETETETDKERLWGFVQWY
jgi:hypothetical protein